jgi:hypothetical protein
MLAPVDLDPSFKQDVLHIKQEKSNKIYAGKSYPTSCYNN